MRRRNNPLAGAVKWLSAIACGLAVLTYAPKVASAVIMGNVWTTGYAGGGFTAVTTSYRPAELRVESDWSSGGGSQSGWAGNYVYNQTYLSVDGHASPCFTDFEVLTQHSAYEPSTGDYDFAETGGSGSCDGSGSSWNPEGEHCSRNAYLVSLNTSTMHYSDPDPGCQ